MVHFESTDDNSTFVSPLTSTTHSAVTIADGRFEIDNNLVENAIRNPVIGRKRWLFIGHPEAGWRSAALYSFILSCRRRGLNPQDYLTDILRGLPTTPPSDLNQLLPAHWKPLAPA